LQDPNDSADHAPYRDLFERSADAILIIEGDTFVDCNEATVRMLRYPSKEDVLLSHPSELSPPTQPDGRDSFEKANEMIAIAFERGSHRFEWDHKRADGEVFPVEVLLTAIEEPGRRTLHVVWRDITERKMLEEQLRQALKMEAIGKLTGGIAHDFNNLLVAVLGHANLLEQRLGDLPELKKHVHAITHAGERAADLVRQLLAFGRKQQLLPVVLDLNELARDMRPLVEGLVGEKVAIVQDLARANVSVRADRGQLAQVLLNLAANARDAMPSGGNLTIATGRVALPRSGAERGADLPSGEYARLAVRDEGGGMDADTSARAFDPFFTTKPPGKGTGLGLATVYGIVKQSGGGVSLASEPGVGTTIEVLLPLSSEPLGAKPKRRPAVAGDRTAKGTVLVVEDEEVVSILVRSALESHGYRVLLANDGHEAVQLYLSREDEIGLVITDVIMPRVNGPEFVSRLKELGKEPRVLFMSGYTDEGLTALHETYGNIEVLEKPFDVLGLMERVRAAIEGE